jgi:hypothetical protein
LVRTDGLHTRLNLRRKYVKRGSRYQSNQHRPSPLLVPGAARAIHAAASAQGQVGEKITHSPLRQTVAVR